ncbi:hypothetical protein Nepgr_012859 [Nepenthes gracilis]|uniref:Uncharacterized protein n=1 Tax=Nepenthes gracilis TaxID=150966 RepID=A0AAD3SGR1_NEPGR|nr:hypothetical protein Nepgr_012859 [Nepenthes gracilis]
MFHSPVSYSLDISSNSLHLNDVFDSSTQAPHRPPLNTSSPLPSSASSPSVSTDSNDFSPDPPSAPQTDMLLQRSLRVRRAPQYLLDFTFSKLFSLDQTNHQSITWFPLLVDLIL